MSRTLALVAALLWAAVPASAQTLPDDVSSLPWTFDGEVRAAQKIGNTLYVGGFFTTVGRPSDVIGPFGVFDAASGQLVNADPTLAGGVVNAAVQDGAGGWFLGGRFVIDGASRTLVRLDAAGRQVPFAPNADGGFFADVRALARQGNVLLVGGAFTNVGGLSRSKLAAIDISTQSVLPWDPSVTGSDVTAMAVSGTSLFVGGEFTAVGGVPRAHVAKFDLTTGALTSWSADVVGTRVSALATHAGLLYVGGEFSQVGGQPRQNVAALDGATGAVTALAPAPTGPVRALTVTDTAVYLGGAFSTVGGQGRHGAAAIDRATGVVLPWAPLTSGASVRALAHVGSDIFLGGASWLPASAGGYAIKVDATTGAPSPNWQPGLGAWVETIVAVGGQVMVGGGFTTRRSLPARGLVGIDLSSGALVPTPAFLDASIWSMTSSGTTLYIGGYFGSIGGQLRTSVAAVDTTTGAVTSFAPVVGVDSGIAVVQALTISGNDLFLGGRFDSVNGVSRKSLAAVDAVTGDLRPFSPPALEGFQLTPAAVASVAVASGRVWAAGAFVSAGGAPRAGLAVFDAVTGTLDPLNPLPMGSGAMTVSAAGGAVFVAGPFTGAFGGQFFELRDGLASFDAATGVLRPWRPPIRSNGGLAVRGSHVFASGAVTQLPLPGALGSGLLLADATSGMPVPWDPQPRAPIVHLADVDAGLVGAAYRSPQGHPAYYYARRATAGAPHAVADFGAHVQGTRVTVRWTPAATGALPTSYTLFAGSRPGASDLAAVSLPRGAGAGLVADVPPGSYYLRVVPHANGVAGPASPDVFVGAGTVGCLSPPPAPVLSIPLVAELSLAWTVNPVAPVAAYELRVGSASGTYDLARVPLAATTTRFSTVGAPPGTYYVVVAASYVCGVTAVSNEVRIVVPPPAAPLPPVNLRATVSGTTVSLSWTPVGTATGYLLDAGSAPGLANIVPGLALGGAPGVVAPDVPPGTYYVRVRAANGALVSVASNEIAVTVP